MPHLQSISFSAMARLGVKLPDTEASRSGESTETVGRPFKSSIFELHRPLVRISDIGWNAHIESLFGAQEQEELDITPGRPVECMVTPVHQLLLYSQKQAATELISVSQQVMTEALTQHLQLQQRESALSKAWASMCRQMQI
jgi:hypothetical protein